MDILFKSVRKVTRPVTSRSRECFACCNKIAKGEKYTNHQYRYDKTILSAYFHTSCYKRELEKRLVVGAKVKIGELYAKNDSRLKKGQIVTLVNGEFEEDNGLYSYNVTAPSLNIDGKEFDSIYHLFGNDLEDFMDCQVLLDSW